MLNKKIIFLGSKEFGLEIFKSLLSNLPRLKWYVLHPDDFKDSRSNLVTFKKFAKTKNVSFEMVSSINELNVSITAINPDIVIVCNYYKIIPDNILNKVPLGFWGIHNSLLPKYRGGSPLVWQFLENEKYIGSSLFRIANGIDNGEICKQIKTKLKASDFISDVMQRLQNKWIKVIPKLVIGLLNKKIKTKKQNEQLATYYSQRKIKDGQILWDTNLTFIDRFIRAQSYPYPGAFFYYGKNKFIITSHQVLKNNYTGSPGQIINKDNKGIIVKCSNHGALKINKVSNDNYECDAANILVKNETQITYQDLN